MPTCGWSTTTWRGKWSSSDLTHCLSLSSSPALLCLLGCRSYGDAVHCRKALHRAVQCTADYPEHVCEVLLSFERVEGELLVLYISHREVSKICKIFLDFIKFQNLEIRIKIKILTSRVTLRTA